MRPCVLRTHVVDMVGPVELGHTKLESTVRYLGIEVEDALEMAEQTEGRLQAQQLARELARLHHAFMESSQPYFQASKVD